jgi:myo-inositol-1(or 4)-monophosphatase
MPDYADELALAKKAAQEAGKILMDNFRNATAYGKAMHDIGTEPEVVAENRIKQIIRQQYPDHNLWAEESGNQDKGGKCTWIIDPLDGTRNYVIGVPNFSVSIALEVGGEVVLGVVYNPYTRSMIYAQKGLGAFAGRKRLRIVQEKTLSEAIICSDWGGSEKDDSIIRQGLQNLETLIFESRVVVVYFSPALDLCRIAMGKADALVNLSTEVEAHAAGALILQEAGGVVTNFGSDKWDVYMRGIIAANPSVYVAIRSLVLGRLVPNG